MKTTLIVKFILDSEENDYFTESDFSILFYNARASTKDNPRFAVNSHVVIECKLISQGNEKC